MGPPGSGKSTLARRLGARMGLPVFHLDQAFHRPGWQPVSDEQFRAAVDRIAAGAAWIIDGNYSGTIGSRFATAEVVVYLDMPTWLTMLRIFKRILGSYGRVRPDAAPGCPERLNGPFLLFAWNWNRLRRTRILALLETYPGRTLIFRGPAEQRRFNDEAFRARS
ncbi:MAG: hypothetical protein ACRYGP_18160 [Janthinobacterium lividum]